MNGPAASLLAKRIAELEDYRRAPAAFSWLVWSPVFDDLPRPCLFCHALVCGVRPEPDLAPRQLDLPLST
jgi:hypothetical protein